MSTNSTNPEEKKIKIIYGTLTGKSKLFAEKFSKECVLHKISSEVINIKDYDPEENLNKESSIVVVFISTYEDGTPPEDAKWFYQWIMDAKDDFRLDRDHLKNLKFSIVGLGSSYYEENFNIVAKNIDSAIEKLSGNRLLPIGICDENVVNSVNGGLDYDYDVWSARFWNTINPPVNKQSACCNEKTSQKDGCCQKGDTKQSQCCKNEKESINNEDEIYSSSEDEENEDDNNSGNELVDVEDLGAMMKQRKDIMKNTAPREMLTPTLRTSLEKQGYKLIGSHSGVKMCRWTKVIHI